MENQIPNSDQANSTTQNVRLKNGSDPRSIGEIGNSILQTLKTRPEPTPDEIAAREEREKQFARESEHRRRNSAMNEFINCRGIRYLRCTLDNFQCKTNEQTEAVASLRAYAKDMRTEVENGTNIVLVGPAGTGKDHLLVGLTLAAIMGFGFKVLWVNGQDLWARIRATMKADARETEMEIVSQLVNAPVLIISDPVPPLTTLSDWEMGVLFRIIDARYSFMRPTWTTLNVATQKEARERLGPQVVDRLNHGAVMIATNWPSFRASR